MDGGSRDHGTRRTSRVLTVRQASVDVAGRPSDHADRRSTARSRLLGEVVGRRRRGDRHPVAAQGAPPLGWSSRTRSGVDAPAGVGAGRAPPPSPIPGRGRRRRRLVRPCIRSPGRSRATAARPDPVSPRPGGLVRARGGPHPSPHFRTRWPAARTTGAPPARLCDPLARTRRWRDASRLDAHRPAARSGPTQDRRQPTTSARRPEAVPLGPRHGVLVAANDGHSSKTRPSTALRPLPTTARQQIMLLVSVTQAQPPPSSVATHCVWSRLPRMYCWEHHGTG